MTLILLDPEPRPVTCVGAPCQLQTSRLALSAIWASRARKIKNSSDVSPDRMPAHSHYLLVLSLGDTESTNTKIPPPTSGAGCRTFSRLGLRTMILVRFAKRAARTVLFYSTLTLRSHLNNAPPSACILRAYLCSWITLLPILHRSSPARDHLNLG